MRQQIHDQLNWLQKDILLKYNDYRNNYLTIEVFARDYGISQEFAEALIKEAKRIHEEYGSL